VETETSAIDYFGQQAFLIMIRDVTELREAEDRIMEAVITTEESERSRIAQDLHDGLGPILSTIKLYFQVYQDAKDEAKRTFLADKLKTTIDEAIKGVSEISRNISPHILRNYGFYAAVKQFINQLEQTKVVSFQLDCGDEREINGHTGIILYRAISELVNNSLRHADCRNISIKIDHQDETIRVDYRDDGKGFDVNSVISHPAKGSGVQNIINRIQALQGTIEYQSEPGKGFYTRLIIPD
jgi:signal transduction histidine kinase